uniref:Amidase domain-containing protein n=1 Tax=Esox lucius TaxID=8010 RepID=A0A6Q2Z2H4_ESOLU
MSLTRIERAQAWILRACMGVLFALFQLLSPRRSTGSTKLPPVSNPLLLMSAMQLSQKIRRREVRRIPRTWRFVLFDWIDLQMLLPLLHRSFFRFEAALLEAAQVDKLIQEESGGEHVLEDRLPLLGVPITIKESLALQGMPHTTGVVSRRGVLSAGDAPPVALLKRAGAIPLGVTNTSELCMWYESHNHLYGICNNPYDLERTPGGSSGGEGSVLGSGASVIGIGSDIGGSIRIPCFFCGVFGHKTTPGVVSNDCQYPPMSGCYHDYLSTGPMCRYAEDLMPMLRIMAGPNAEKLSLSVDVDLRKLRFFSIPHDGGSPLVNAVDRQLLQAQRRVVDRLEADLGVKVQEVFLPGLKYGFQIWNKYMGLPDKEGKPPTPFSVLFGEPGRPVWPLWELVKWMIGRSPHTMAAIGVTLAEMTSSSKPSPFILKQKEKLQKEFEELLGTDGVLFYPSHPHLTPKHHHTLFSPFNFAYTAIINILGLPVTQCPLGLSEEGLPLGVQVVTGKYQDRQSLAVALYLEKTFGGWRDPGAA